MIELREIELFLALAEELHFGRSAERLGVTPSRVSQMLRGLERKLGGELISRSSRRVTLTPFGVRLLDEIRSPYDEFFAALERVTVAHQALQGTLRLGLLAANSGGPHLTAIIDEFEGIHPECEVVVSEVFFTDPFGSLRRCEIDVMATPLPTGQPDLTDGPVLAREAMVLAVAHDHPLAGREHVSIEDIADYQVAPITDFPKELIDTVFPRRTPSGRPIHRLTRRPKTPHEVTALIARGRTVHPTVLSFAQYFGQPGIIYIPISDMPRRRSGLVWRRRDTSPRLREFIRVTRRTLAAGRNVGGGVSQSRPSNDTTR
jgi:DNA-binding transcriptional LysR family regulator